MFIDAAQSYSSLRSQCLCFMCIRHPGTISPEVPVSISLDFLTQQVVPHSCFPASTSAVHRYFSRHRASSVSILASLYHLLQLFECCIPLRALKNQFCFLFQTTVYKSCVLCCSYMMSLPKEKVMLQKMNLRKSAGAITILCQTLESQNGFMIFQYHLKKQD